MKDQDALKEFPPLIDKFFPFNIFHNKHAGNNILHLHWHQDIEIIYMIEGHAIFYIGNNAISTVPGDILFVNKGLLHSGYSVDNTYVDFYALLFDDSILGNSEIDPYQFKFTAPFINGKFPFPNKIDQTLPHYPLFREYVDKIIHEFDSSQIGHQFAIKSILNLMIVDITRYYYPNMKASNENTINVGEIERFKKLLLYVNDHYSDKITVDEAAKLVNLSTYHFCRTFKKLTGRTFIEYLNLYRVNEAEYLLRETTDSITEISSKVGFNNINYFTQIFKHFKRYPPSHSRKQI